MKDHLESIIKSIIKELYLIDKRIILTLPPSKDLGDFTTSIALQISKVIGRSPKEIGEELKSKICTVKDVIKVEIAGPGFINIYVKSDSFFHNLLDIDEYYGIIKNNNPKKIMVEFGHPNTHKLPHIGHLYSYIVGNSLERILTANGNQITGANYQGDIGPHVAKCIYGWIQKGRPIPELLIDKVKLLQECYQEGSELYEQTEHKDQINQINIDIYNPKSLIQKDWEITRQWSVNYYKEFESFLGIDQKFHYFESEIWQSGFDIVKKNTGKIFVESEGAIIFPGDQYGLHNRVFITQNGTPTYEAKEIGLLIKKREDVNFDLNITPTAREQDGYFKVVLKAIEDIFPELEGKLIHIGFGMVSLSTGKMSSRKGNILSATELVEMTISRISEIMKNRENLAEKEKDNITKIIALGAIKYALLKGNILKDMKFDLEESISFDGHSGPYLQYVYARIKSVLSNNIETIKINKDNIASFLNTNEEKNLAIDLFNYPEIVKEAGELLAPHLLAQYLFELAQVFNKFYNICPINSAEDINIISARRLLAEKTSIVMKAGLALLGIEIIEKM